MKEFAIRMFAMGVMAGPLVIWLNPPWYVAMSMLFTAGLLYDAYDAATRKA